MRLSPIPAAASRRFAPVLRRSVSRLGLGMAVGWGLALPALADDSADSAPAVTAPAVTTPAVTAPVPARPAIQFNRWQEDWSALADPALRTDPFDDLKYIPLSATDPKSYASFGMTVRERYEGNDAPSFGVGHQPSANYLLQRVEVHADVRPNEHWQVFTELQDERAFWKIHLSPVDQDKVDVEQAFVTYSGGVLGGDLKVRVGRQEMAFDLQRFVAVRDGPNVRQAFDAVWANWEQGPWRFITFWSRPVTDKNDQAFDDVSNKNFQYGGFRVERQNVGPGALSVYYSRYDVDNAKYLAASGVERRDILDVRYAGNKAGIDWDLEAMGQGGTVGGKDIRAWAVGSITGYTVGGAPWQPRFSLQADAASGNRNPAGHTINTFNPLFPNGYYFTLAGYEGYTNIIHLKPAITVHPTPQLKVMAALGLQWRETASDAVYVQPNVPVAGTAGHGDLWTGAYGQFRADYAFNANLTGAIEAVHFHVGNAIRAAGGHDSDYLGVQTQWAW